MATHHHVCKVSLNSDRRPPGFRFFASPLPIYILKVHLLQRSLMSKMSVRFLLEKVLDRINELTRDIQVAARGPNLA